jgi:S1-C subfamily serine protease
MEEDDVVEVIEKTSRSVVNINTLRVLHDFFYQVVPVKGMGSGFIVDEKGYILTNNHVIANAEKIAVTLTDGRVVEGRLVGTCRTADVAVIKIDGKNLVWSELGDSDKLRVGQRVFAIGNPFGLAGGPTVTSGVISALNRTIQSREGMFKDLVQTDAAINPGNSGGPLIDVEGRVVAINTAIIPFAQGIGFAIPVNVAKTCTSDLIAHGAMMRPWLGITGLSINREIAAQHELPVERGVFVANIAPNSPADKGGMRQRDIILEFGGKRVDLIEELQKALADRNAGEKVELTVLRGQRTGRLEVVLERIP